jgi:hypothetical protein
MFGFILTKTRGNRGTNSMKQNKQLITVATPIAVVGSWETWLSSVACPIDCKFVL